MSEQRTRPQTLREEFRARLLAGEASELGVDLPAGADHYRAYVGPPFNYDINGGMQFEFLLDLGLREYHRMLEIGCGSLRLGRLLIIYLLSGRYFGVEPNVKILHEGLRNNLGGVDGDVVKLKRPTFLNASEFDYRFTGAPVDFIFAQSIASHTGVTETRRLIKAIADVSHDGTVAMVTYIRAGRDAASNTEDGWFYPKCVSYTDQFMARAAADCGLHAYRTRWPLANQRQDGLITTQVPLILTKKPWRPPLAHRAYGIKIEGVTQLHAT